MQLGRLGVWYSTDKLGGPQQISQFVGIVEQLGYDTLWYPESRGYESLSVAGFMLANSTKLKFGSSIVSHVPMVEGIRGHKYEKPVPAMRAYLDGITKGEAGSENWPIAIAALGPLMLKLAAQTTRGALPYNTTPRHTAEAAKILGPDKWLVAEQKVCLETDPAAARAEVAKLGVIAQEALDELRSRLGGERIDYAELVVLGARAKARQLPDDAKTARAAAQRLAGMVRDRSIPVDVRAADEVKRLGLIAD